MTIYGPSNVRLGKSWAHYLAADVHDGLEKKLLRGRPIDQRYLPYLDPNHPLLVKLSTAAIGTFRHSVIVGSVAASAAAKVQGANPDLARLLGYFHDTGKMIRPELYAEARMGNRAEKHPIATVEDLKTMLNHPIRSREFAWKYKLPEEVCDLLIEHHGTVRTRIKLDPAMMDQLQEAELHYQGRRHTTIESGIVHFVDSASAFFETQMDEKGWLTEDHSEQSIMGRIEKVHSELVEEGQFDVKIFSPADQKIVTEAIFVWFFRFYNHLRLFGTPQKDEFVADGRLPWPDY